MFIPYKDLNPTEREPYWTWLLVAANVAAFAATFDILTMPPSEQIVALEAHGALVPARPEAPDFLTSMFLHGSIGHLFGNMLFLWITGDNIEDAFGRFAYPFFYVFCGIVGGLAHVAVAPGSTVPLVGASGAISGLMGAYVVLYPNSRVRFFYWFFIRFAGTFEIRAMWWLGAWFGFQLLLGGIVGAEGGGVAYAAHIGGFVVGAGAAYTAYRIGWVEGGVEYDNVI